MRYRKLTGIILKKQNYREADQIVTIWSREAGKVRFLGRSLRLPRSKLNYNLQDLSLVELELAGSRHLPALISAKTLNSFVNVRQNLSKIGAGLFAAELMLKMTADEASNPQAFDLLAGFLKELNRGSALEDSVLDDFCLDLLASLGFGAPKEIKSHKQIKNFIESILERDLKSESFMIYAQ